MHNYKLRFSRKHLIFVVIVALAFCITPVYAQPGILSTEQLYQLAYRAQQQGNWIDTARYLTAYVQRDPTSMRNNQTFARQIEQNLNSAISRLNRMLTAARAAGLEVQFFVIGTPDTLPPDPASLTTPVSYPLVCRGGGEMLFTYIAGSLQPQLRITFHKADTGVGDNWQDSDRVSPGECSWLDRAIAADEPNQLIIADTSLAVEQLAVTWQQGEIISVDVEDPSPNGNPLHSILALQSSAGTQLFYAYNDRAGNLIVSGYDRTESTLETEILYHIVDVVTDEHLNMRSGPGVAYSPVGTIPRNGSGILITAIGQDVDGALWVPVRYGGVSGWANSLYLDLTLDTGLATSNYLRPLQLQTPQIKGLDVRLVQRRLHTLGYMEVGPTDGIFGPRTESGVKRFQQVNGLDTDGKVDPSTWESLFSEEAAPNP